MAYSLLKGKKGIIFGALNENSIAWKIAQKAHEEGAHLVLSNAPIVMKKPEIKEGLTLLTEQLGAKFIEADATSKEDLNHLFDESLSFFGTKIDFILHSIGMSKNVRKKRPYTDLDYGWIGEGWDISAVSFHKIMKAAWDREAMNEWGSILALSYIAAQRVFPDYSDMADNKAYLESIARSFGYYWGEKYKVRVNTISQSPTPTTAGQGIKGFNNFLNYASALSPLGNASAEDCANYAVMLFSDFTRKVTMQNLFHDGGFSSVGITQEVMDKFD